MSSRIKADYPGDILAICSGKSLHLWKLEEQKAATGGGSGIDAAARGTGTLSGNRAGDDKNVENVNQSIDVGRFVTAAAWNRNNKVVAIGMDDGTVQLRYANGGCMSTLKDAARQETDQSRQVKSMSWSIGSKTLAVGSVGGVQIHDMSAKTSSWHEVAETGQGSQIGVAHHPEDSFLAVSGGDVQLYSLRMDNVLGKCLNPLPKHSTMQQGSYFSSVSVGSVLPYLAAGTERNGVVSIWDYSTQQIIGFDKYRHGHKGACKVAFAPLEPFLLYSVGWDGILKMQDLRLGSSISSTTALLNTYGHACSLSIREETGEIAVGTSDGHVMVYARGLAAKRPLCTLDCGGGQEDDIPVLDISWQHSFHNLPLYASKRMGQEEIAKRVSVGSPGDYGNETKSFQQKQQVPLPSSSSSSSRYPLSQAPSASHDIQDDKIETTTKMEESSGHSPIQSQQQDASARHTAYNSRYQSVSEQSSDKRWQIKATAAGDRPINQYMTSPTNSNTSDVNTKSPFKTKPANLKKSIALDERASARKLKHVEETGTKGPLATAVASVSDLAPEGHENQSIRDDILAMHLDMLNMFQEQQGANTRLMKEMMERQDALARDIASMRQRLEDVMTRRDGTLWLLELQDMLGSLGIVSRLVQIPHKLLVRNKNVKSSSLLDNALHRQAVRVGGRTRLYSNKGNNTTRLAIPEQSSSSSSFSNDFIMKYDSTIEDILGSQFRMMRDMERGMEKAMERAIASQEGMMADRQEASSEKREWKREWKSQTPTSSSYFSESVTIIQPAAGAGNSRSMLAHNSSAAVALAAVVPLVLLSMSWARKTREFMNVYDQTVYKDTRSKWLLVSLWPVLCLISPKFRKEWERVMVKRRPNEAIGIATSNHILDSGDDHDVGSTGSNVVHENDSRTL
eukprot:jgi/Picsp_1/3183/NSC_06023-R1_hypothetical protein CHLNCDRAFT_143608 [Chlorella variabilis]